MALNPRQKIREHLSYLYGPERADDLTDKVMEIVSRYANSGKPQRDFYGGYGLSQNDCILITYADVVRRSDEPGLKTLRHFISSFLDDLINTVHILPFYPFSSDDGFSVIDYRQVDPNLGTWKDIHDLAATKRLMFDAVVNHISQHSVWFKSFLKGEMPYNDFFLVPDEHWDFSSLVRPRTRPVLSEFDVNGIRKKVWTTFSSDQIDLNFANPEVLLEVLDLLGFYTSQGASLIRLDAVAYLWKASGTSSINLEQTHRLIKLMRLVLDLTEKDVTVITETNVPHEENISYFGETDPETGQTDEAHMVYQFPLAPLVLHTLMTGDSTAISKWSDSLDGKGIYFNFVASHDGIGVMPAKGVLTDEEIALIVSRVEENGGMVSYKSMADGSQVVYELNTTLYDALNDPKHQNPALDIPRYIASQVIMLSMMGVPGIYYLSLFGFRNSHASAAKTGRARSINRQKFQWSELEERLSDPHSPHAEVFKQYKNLLLIRKKEAAFHPNGGQEVLRLDHRVFALRRVSPYDTSVILVLVNISGDEVDFDLDLQSHSFEKAISFEDLLSGIVLIAQSGHVKIHLKPYQSYWLKERRFTE